MSTGKRHDLIVNTSVVITVVALGIVVAGLLPHDVVAESDSSNAPSFTTKPVGYPVDIPGCDVVEPPPSGDGAEFSISASLGGREPTYDNPAFPWLTAGKATAMSDAVRAALPPDVIVELAAPSQSLTFGPIDDKGEDIPVDPVSRASAELVRADRSGAVTISVGESDSGVPDCVAGNLDARIVDTDGTVVDTLDSWFAIDGARYDSRNATAYHPDGTKVTLQIGGSKPSAWPLEPDEAASIVALPDLSVSAQVPAGTPAPREDCSVYAPSTSSMTDIRPSLLDAANAALTSRWESIPNTPVLDRPIGSLVPESYSSGVCTDVDVTSSDVDLSVSVAGGQQQPVAIDPYDPSVAYGAKLPVVRTLPDGSVMKSDDVDFVGGLVSDDGTQRLVRAVTVTQPNGVQVSVRSSAGFPPNLQTAPLTLPEPLPFAILEALAQTPIAMWP